MEQDIRNNNFGIRNGNFEKNAVVKNQGTKHRGQRILGDRWQWEANGQCSKGDNCSFRHDANKRGKVTPSIPSPNSFVQQSERKTSITRSHRGKSHRVKVSALGVRKLRKMIERVDPLSTVTCTQHDNQGGMMTKLGLLKSGKLTNRWMLERCNPL